jgi:hypothetical protein
LKEIRMTNRKLPKKAKAFLLDFAKLCDKHKAYFSCDQAEIKVGDEDYQTFNTLSAYFDPLSTDRRVMFTEEEVITPPVHALFLNGKIETI